MRTETKKCMGSLIQYGNVIQVRDMLCVRIYIFQGLGVARFENLVLHKIALPNSIPPL